jgi:DedD protein
MEQTRERIFGAVVIVSLLVIFGPMLFEATKQHRIQMAKSLPEAPSSADIAQEDDLIAMAPIVQPFSAQRKELAQQDIADALEELHEPDSVEKSIADKKTTEIVKQKSVPKVANKVETKNELKNKTPKAEAPVEVAKAERPDLKTKQKLKPKPKPEPARVEDSHATVDNVATMSVPSQQIAMVSKGWSVQLGTFGNEANAKRLVSKLKQSGYPAYITTKQSGSRKLNVVLVGPQLNKSDAQNLINILAQQYKLKGIIVKYQPI